MVFAPVRDRSTCSAIMSHYTAAAQGCEGKIIQSPYEAVSGKRMGPNEREGLYIGSNSAQGATLLFVDLNGTAQILWQSQEVGGGAFIGGVPSPDGRYLAIFGGARNSNAWLVEGF